MTEEHSKYLFDNFWFYKPKDIYHSLMGFGFECPDEWYEIILKLSKKIAKHLKNKDCREWFYVTQVKEKFGMLRFYTSLSDKKIDKWIDQAEWAVDKLERKLKRRLLK